MSLLSVLVDQARIVRYTAVLEGTPPQPVKVEGETKMAWVYGEWFPARIDAPEAAETPDAAGGRVRTDVSPTLIFALEDDDGNAVKLVADDRVQVDSEELGLAVWELTGQPTLYRKKSDLVGGSVTVKRVLDFGVAGLPEQGTATVGVTNTGNA